MTRDDFIKRWKCHLAGMALFGVASETKDGPLARAAKVLDIPAEVERLLGRMYDDVSDSPVNGQKSVAPRVGSEAQPGARVPDKQARPGLPVSH